MAKIIDPDNLNQGTEVDFITGSLEIRLNVAGNLSEDGVSFQTLYSFVKEEWKNDNNLIKFPFPMNSITSEQFELINGWNWANIGEAPNPTQSAYLVRDGGWAVVNPTTGNNEEEWMNITTLGLFDDANNDLAYFLQQDPDVVGFASAIPEDFQLTGPVNQGVQIFASASGNFSDFNYRDFFRIYLREPNKTYGFGDLIVDQNLSNLTFRKFAIPLTNGTDLKADVNDNIVTGSLPYVSMSIQFLDTPVTRTIGSADYTFDTLIDGNSGTAEEIYEFVQWSLRQTTDIDSGSGEVRGDIAEGLLTFIGDTLRTSQGVYIDNFLSADTNRLEFTETGSTVQTFPFVAAGTLQFNTNLTSDTDAIYKVFFTNDDTGDNTGRDFGTQDAIIINDNSGNPITGSVDGTASIAFDYDYEGNIQRGSDSTGSLGTGTIVPFTGVALGLNTAQYVVTTGTIIRSTANSINFVAALERNYVNPA